MADIQDLKKEFAGFQRLSLPCFQSGQSPLFTRVWWRFCASGGVFHPKGESVAKSVASVLLQFSGLAVAAEMWQTLPVESRVAPGAPGQRLDMAGGLADALGLRPDGAAA